MKILVLNCGSSSLKFRLFEMDDEKLLAKGIVEEIGHTNGRFKCDILGRHKIDKNSSIANHKDAIELVQRSLCDKVTGCIKEVDEIDAIGHRVVHGGEAFTSSVFINEAVMKKLHECVRFAPLHNPSNIEGIKASLWQFPFARQAAVFDTAFHQTMEQEAFIYALPYSWYKEKGIRKYGFHGTSHRYVAEEAARILGKPFDKLKIITCHLGSGASMAAVKNGKSIDTSMGFTPLEGMIMGTRCGDIDPAIPLYVMEADGLSASQMDTILNKKSGVFGLTEGISDMRIVEDYMLEGKERYVLVIKMVARRVKKYIGAYAAVMGGVDAVVFTAGVGEHSLIVRQLACEGLEFLGISLDNALNDKNEVVISSGKTAVMVIPTNEELAIARETKTLLTMESNTGDRNKNE